MKKTLLTVFLIILMTLLAYFIFIQNFEIFPSERIELVEFRKDGINYSIYAYQGNATVSSNIQLVKNEKMLGLSKTMRFYNQGKIIMKNDSIINVSLSNNEDNYLDTFRIKFTEPVSFNIMN